MPYVNPVCRGCWQLGNNCGSCERCRAEAKAALKECNELRALLHEYADHAEDSGWKYTALELRVRVYEIEKRNRVER